VTSVPRTIADLRRSSLPARWIRRAIRQAEIAGLDLGAEVEGDRTRSDVERAFLRICRTAGFPAPLVNVKVGRRLVDFLWPAERLAVETDSYKYHRGSIAFEDDHARDLDLRARGYEVRRFSERQVMREPRLVVADLTSAFAQRS
jgi:very-short-patch-repair endonuclease